MDIPDAVLEAIRAHSKDESSYRELVCLFRNDIAQIAEEQFRRASSSLHAMLNSTWHSFTLIDRHYRIIDANDKTRQAAQAIFGRRIQPGDSIYDFVLPRDHESFTANYERALQGETVTVVRPFSTSEGKNLFFEIVYNPVFDGDQVIGVCMIHQDITEQKQVDDRLRRYRNVIASVEDGISLVNRDYVYEIVNDAYLKRTDLRRDQIEGHHVADIVGEVPFQTVVKSYMDRSLNGETVRYEAWFELPASGRSYFRVVYSPYYDEYGQIAGVIVNTHDLTEKRAMEERLAASEERLRRLVENIPVMVDAFADDMTISLWNKECERVTGYSAEEMIGNPLAMQMLYPDKDYYDRMWAEIASAPLDFRDRELLITCKDGTQKVISWSNIADVVPIEGWNSWAVGIDVTKRKRIERVLRESEARYRDMFENNQAVKLLIDSETGLIVDANTAAADYYGYSRDTLLTMRIQDINILTDAEIKAEMARARNAKRTVFNFKHRLSSDEIRNVEVFSGPITLQGKQYLYSIILDVTEQKLAQQREIELQLETERRQLLASFFQNASHEFRTPLATISLGVSLMARLDDPQRRVEKGEKIDLQIKKINQLVDALLLMTRLDSADAMAQQPVEIGTILGITCERSAYDCPKEHNLRCETLPYEIFVMGDADYLSDAFKRIIDNACQFTAEGGVIEVITTEAENQVHIEIRDRGPGISNDALPHIFELFWRQDVARTTPGFGLGLPIARKIIEQHGGQISVESQEGQGTTVLVTLPIVG